MKKLLFLLFVLFHFSVIIYNNIKIEAKAVNKYLFKQRAAIADNHSDKTSMVHNIVATYSKYTGTETGYGFYAPNVSSQVVLMLTKIDSRGNTISIDIPRLNSSDANIRFCNAMDFFLDKIDNRDSVYNVYMNIVLKSIALWTINNDVKCKKVVADLLIYDLPAAAIKAHKRSPKYLKLGHYEFSDKEYVAKN